MNFNNIILYRPRAGMAKILLVMKLIVVLLTAAILQVSASSFAQKITLTEKNAPLDKIFDKIRKQCGYDFIVTSDMLKQAKPVSISVNNAELKEVLAVLFERQPLSFDIQEKMVVVKEKTPSFLDKIKSAFADTDVRGRVVDEKGNPMPNASIRLKGKDVVINTNDKGEFALKGVADDAILVISYVGYKQLEIPVKGAVMPLEIKLNQVTGELEEVKVVYNTGFQLVDKTRATGSFVQIDNKLLNRQIGSNILDRLEGVTNGLLFDKRIDPSTGAPKNNIQIRGFYSLNEKVGSPLIVLDNFPYNGDINNINPNDIENVTILRDAASASIWGAKAGNGVIVLTSKRGKYDQVTSVSLNLNTSVQGKPNLFDLPILGSSEQIDLEKMFFSKGTYDWFINDYYSMPALTPVLEILSKQRNGEISETEANSKIDKLRTLDVRNDFLKYFYQASIGQRYAASLSGGGSNYNYIFNIGYDRNQAELVGNQTQRLSISLNNTFKPFKNMDIQVGINYTPSRIKNNSPGGYGNGFYNGASLLPMPLYSRFTNDQGEALAIPFGYRASFTDTLRNGRLLSWDFKPLEELRNRHDVTQNQAILFTTGVNYKIVSFLHLDLKYQYQKNTGVRNLINSIKTYEMRSLINEFTNFNETDLSKRYPIPVGGRLRSYNTTMESHGLRGRLNFSRGFAKKHDVVAQIGFSLDQENTISNGNTLYGYTDNLSYTAIDPVNYYPTILGYGPLPSISEPSKEALNRLVSFFSTFSYIYDNKYTFNCTIRRDASNLFGVETINKWKPLWSVGLTWNVKKELLAKFDLLSNLSLRGTFGYQGNINNSLSAYNIFYYSPATSNSVVKLPFASIRSLGNPRLRWEEVNTLNFAADFDIKDQTLSGSIEYYKKKSKDVIAAERIDPTTGFTSQDRNSADIAGNGINIGLIYKILNTRNLNWSTSFNYGTARYKIVEIKNGSDNLVSPYYSAGTSVQYLKGYNPYSVFSLKWAGLDPETGDPQGMLNGRISKNYDSLMYYSPFTEVIKHGSGVPEMYGNLLNSFKYKNLSLSFNIVYQLKYFVKRTPFLNDDLAYGNRHIDYLKRWQKTGDELHTSIPSFVYPQVSNRDQFYESSEVAIMPGDHIRLNDLQLSYSLKKIGSYKFKQLTFNATLGNLNILLWKKNKQGIDPSYPNGNITGRTITLGLSASF